MIKVLSAIALAAFIAAALTILPGFAPSVEAGPTRALQKADRLQVKPVGRGCSQKAWPHFETICLRSTDYRGAILQEARLVTTERR